MDINEFGHTKNPVYLERANAFREAAAADGWDVAPTYAPNEPITSASRGTKDGFVFQIITRTKGIGKWPYQASVSLWGPDGMAIEPPEVYDWNAIQAAVSRCNYCQAEGVPVVRVGFAGRCCLTCLSEVRKKVEYPGWTR